jgi:methionyl-tRNA formyltransferase
MSRVQKFRIHFVTEDDPLYVVEFFDTFFGEYPKGELQVMGVTIQKPFNESKLSTAKRVFSLYGFAGFARLLVRVVAQKLRGRSIAALARREGIQLVPTTSVNAPDFVRKVATSRPDVIVSVAAPEIFRHEILQAARLGCINVHSGRLPAYRGMMPTFWQMLSGERQATVTVHEMTAVLDAGAVLGTAECPIRERDSLDRVIVETKQAAARLMIRVLGELAAGTSAARALEMTTASYHSFPKRDDARRFRRRGHRML